MAHHASLPTDFMKCTSCGTEAATIGGLCHKCTATALGEIASESRSILGVIITALDIREPDCPLEAIERLKAQRDTATANAAKMQAALERIQSSIPACDGNGGLYEVHHDGEGNELGTQPVDPMAVIQHVAGIAQEALK